MKFKMAKEPASQRRRQKFQRDAMRQSCIVGPEFEIGAPSRQRPESTETENINLGAEPAALRDLNVFLAQKTLLRAFLISFGLKDMFFTNKSL